MAVRVGIAADMVARKWELEQEFKNARDWKITEPFMTKAEAQAWLKENVSKKCKAVKDGAGTKRLQDPWFGFCFDHDGPK